MPASESRAGAYGFRLAGLDGAAEWLVAAPEAWPKFTVDVEVGARELDQQLVGRDRIALFLRTGGELVVDASARTIRFRLRDEISASALVHPYLAPAAEVAAHLLGRESFHAGALVGSGGAWGVIGDRGSGKSSTLALLGARGTPIVADDVLVLEGTTVFAGPRAIDLRREPAEHLGIGEPLGVVGARERWRVTPPLVEPEHEMRGWIFLAWGEADTRRLGGAEALARLGANRGVNLPPPRAEALLPLAALPAYEVRRPNELESLDRTGQVLLGIASES